MQQRLSNYFSSCLRRLYGIGLRIIITGLIFTTCLVVASSFLGLPVPSPSELLDNIKNVSKLSEVLS